MSTISQPHVPITSPISPSQTTSTISTTPNNQKNRPQSATHSLLNSSIINDPAPATPQYDFGLQQLFTLKSKALNYIEQTSHLISQEAAHKAQLIEAQNEIIALRSEIALLNDTIHTLQYAGMKNKTKQTKCNQVGDENVEMNTNIIQTPTKGVSNINNTDDESQQQLCQRLQQQQQLIDKLKESNIEAHQRLIATSIERDKYRNELSLSKNHFEHLKAKNDQLLETTKNIDLGLIKTVQAKLAEYDILSVQFEGCITKHQTKAYQTVLQHAALHDNIDFLQTLLSAKSDQIASQSFHIHQLMAENDVVQREVTTANQRCNKLAFSYSSLTKKHESILKNLSQAISLQQQTNLQDKHVNNIISHQGDTNLIHNVHLKKNMLQNHSWNADNVTHPHDLPYSVTSLCPHPNPQPQSHIVPENNPGFSGYTSPISASRCPNTHETDHISSVQPNIELDSPHGTHTNVELILDDPPFDELKDIDANIGLHDSK